MVKNIFNNLFIIKYLIIFYFGLIVGKHLGFRDGVEVTTFDRNTANLKLQQCLRIVRHE
jgi:hypothetical protein